jgi:hypothetical protein
MEEIEYSILHRWFVGLNLDEQVWDVLVHEVAKEFLAQVVGTRFWHARAEARRPS